jgi:hypothetical protein
MKEKPAGRRLENQTTTELLENRWPDYALIVAPMQA